MTRTITVTTEDIISWRYTREHWRPVKLLECQGFSAGSDPSPLFSRWPGRSPGQGSSTIRIEKLIVNSSDSQADMNQRCGRHGAAADGVYVDANGVEQYALDLELVLPLAYHVADFYDELVDVQFTTALRGLNLTNQSFFLKGVNLELDENGSGVVRWTLRTCTNGATGSTYRPKQTNPPTGVTDPVTVPLSLPVPNVPLPTWTTEADNQVPLGGFVLNGSGAQAALMTAINTTTGVITYSDISTGLSGNGMWACGDPFDYRRMFALTADGLYRCDNKKAFTSWVLVASNATMFGNSSRVGHKIAMSINRRGFIMVMSHSYLVVSYDYGANWQTPTDPGSMTTWGTSTLLNSSGDFAISPHNGSGTGEGHIIASVYVGVLNGNQYSNKYYLSTDWGATWTFIATRYFSTGGGGTIPPGGKILIPYYNYTGAPNLNGSTQEVWITEGRQGAGLVTRSNGRIASSNTQMLFSTTVPYPVSTGQSPLALFTYGSQYWAVGSGAGTVHGFYTGSDSTSHSLGTPTSQAVSVNGWPLDPRVWVIWATLGTGSTPTNTISITFDNGATMYNSLRPAFFTGAAGYTAYVELDLSDYVAPQ